MSKEVHAQASTRRERLQLDPNLHYVMEEIPSNNWDGKGLDDRMDEFDEHGEPAYTIIARGDRNDNERYKAGSRRAVILACSKEHAEKKLSEVARISKERATQVTPRTAEPGSTWESMEVQEALRLPDAVDRHQSAKQEIDAISKTIS